MTDGSPDDWPILVRGHEDPVFQRFEMDVTTFISRVMKREILLPTLWPEEIFEDASRLVFQSMATEAEAEPRKTVYQLYSLNDNQAGFWIHHEIFEGCSELYFKSIDGKTQGELNVDGKVLVDIYENGALTGKNVELLNATDPEFCVKEAPDWWNG